MDPVASCGDLEGDHASPRVGRHVWRDDGPRSKPPGLLNQGSRKLIHIAATRNPSQGWTVQQLRNATMEGLAPRFLIRDRDEKFGVTFDRAAEGFLRLVLLLLALRSFGIDSRSPV